MGGHGRASRSVGRRLRVTYLADDVAALGVIRGTKVSRDLGRVIRELCDAVELPAPGDSLKLLPPSVEYGPHVAVSGRRVPGHNLWGLVPRDGRRT
jgi:hypothetical protein